MSEPSKDLTTVNGVRSMLDANALDITGVAPKHVEPEAFIGLALSLVRRDPFLARAVAVNPMSFIHALRECAALGHMPLKGIASLVAFNDKRAPGGMSIVLMEEYRGVIDRMWRAGGIRSVDVNVGREHDEVLRYNKLREKVPHHVYDEFAAPAERGPLKAVYAWAETISGGIQVVWLNRHEVARARSMSKTAMKEGANGGAFWGPEWPSEGPNTEAMWKKTALHRLEALVPTSAEYRWEVARAEAVHGPPSGDFQPPTGRGALDYEDAVIVSEGGSEAAGGPVSGVPPQDPNAWNDVTVARPPDEPAAGTQTGGRRK